MFQEPRLLPWLTVTDNLRLVVTSDMPPPPDIHALLALIRLPDAGDLYPRQLSLGMARRVALARALAVSPELLVLDEPFASLDPQLTATLAEVIERWTHDTLGAAVLLAAHDTGASAAPGIAHIGAGRNAGHAGRRCRRANRRKRCRRTATLASSSNSVSSGLGRKRIAQAAPSRD